MTPQRAALPRSSSSMSAAVLPIAVGNQPACAASVPSSQRFAAAAYFTQAAAVSCVLRASSDLVGQTLSLGEANLAHVAAMGTVGLLFSGFIGAAWLATLERALGDGSEAAGATTVRKAAADYLIYAPLANSAYLLAVPFLTALYSQCADLDLASTAMHSLDTWHSSIVSAMQLEAAMFLPFNLLSFRVIPADFRPQASALMSAGFTVCLSTMC